MATAPTYITHKQFKRIFPQLDEFDQKTQIFGWESLTVGASTIYYASDTGLVDNLYIDGRDLSKLKDTLYVPHETALWTVKTAMTNSVVACSLESGGSIDKASGESWDDSIIKIDNEIMYVTAITEPGAFDIFTIERAKLDTIADSHSADANIYGIFRSGKADDLYRWIYDSTLDTVFLRWSSNPNDLLVEAGESFTTMVTQFRADASRYFDSRVDPSLPREQLKDKSGNYDYMVVRTVGLIAACFMIRTKDHNSEVATSFMEEAERNIQLLNEGKAALSWQNTSDASQGIIRDVAYTGALRPVDTRGEWNGSYDLIKLEIETAGAIGTATYNVWVKDSDGLKNNKVISNEKITGDFQTLAGGLQIRFGGETDSSAAVATDEWEIEVTGRNEYVDSSDMKGIMITRRGTPARGYYK